MSADPITAAVHFQANLLVAVRLVRFIHTGEILMPLELNRLKASALAARANYDRVCKAYDKFNKDAPAHAADVEGMAADIGMMGSDLAFAVNTLGNGAPPSGDGSKAAGESQSAQKPPAATSPALTPENAQEATVKPVEQFRG